MLAWRERMGEVGNGRSKSQDSASSSASRPSSFHEFDYEFSQWNIWRMGKQNSTDQKKMLPLGNGYVSHYCPTTPQTIHCNGFPATCNRTLRKVGRWKTGTNFPPCPLAPSYNLLLLPHQPCRIVLACVCLRHWQTAFVVLLHLAVCSVGQTLFPPLHFVHNDYVGKGVIMREWWFPIETGKGVQHEVRLEARYCHGKIVDGKGR